MFRKLVSNIPFSPSLMNDLVPYRTKFGKELSVRSITIFLALVFLCTQTFVLISPAQSTLSASNNDLIYDGAGKTPKAIIESYKANRDVVGNTDIKSIYAATGISENDLEDYRLTTLSSFHSGEYWILGRSTHGTTQEVEIPIQNGPTLFARQLYELSSKKSIKVMEVSTRNGFRWIALESGNVILPTISGIIQSEITPQKVCTTPEKNCLKYSVEATNMTQDSPAQKVVAQAGDSIEYTFTATNYAKNAQKVQIQQNLNDVLEYADIIDATGAQFMNGPTKTLVWPNATAQPNSSIVRTLLVKIKTPIPRTPAATSDPLSYNQSLSTQFGNALTVTLPTTRAKSFEQFAAISPTLSPIATFGAALVLFALTTLLYLRSRLLYKELWIITHEFNGPTQK